MKKLYFLIFLLILCQASYSQRVSPAVKHFAVPSHLQVSGELAARDIMETDTLYPGSLSRADSCGKNLVIYTAGEEGGYAVGNNGYGDLEMMQKYSIGGQSSVTSVLVLFGAKTQVDANSNLYAKVYSVGPDGAPGQQLGISQPVTLGSIDTAIVDFTTFTFETPVMVADSFFVGFVNPTTPGDTIGALSTRDSCFTGQSLAWSMVEDSTFLAFDDEMGWGMQIDLMIFPVISDVLASANSPEVMRMLKLHHAYPNPAQDVTTIGYELRERTKINIDVFDITGKKLLHVPVGMQQPGAYKNELDISSLKTGMYFYTITTDKGSLTGRISVNR